MSVVPRLNRLLAEDGRCFDVAIDHGFFNERSFLNNIEDMPRVVQDTPVHDFFLSLLHTIIRVNFVERLSLPEWILFTAIMLRYKVY